MPLKNKEFLSWAHPLIQEWFSTHLGEPSQPQLQGWPEILRGKNTLISAPTGSGKTLAAFLVCIDKLLKQSIDNSLVDKTEVIYVSPLKALTNDIQKNLTLPLQQIENLAKEKRMKFEEIRVAVRTGDTLAAERQLMIKKPPHIIVTTPESLFILLTAEKSRKMLEHVHTVIVDEIHAVANSKRGSHLALSLERLEHLTQNKLQRIGLSATQKPINIVAEFLVGCSRKQPAIIDIGYKRNLELSVEVPKLPLGSVASNEMWDEIYDRLAELIAENRSTLIFVNTRKLAERIAHHLKERIGEDKVLAHHGSLSRKIRLNAEEKLKQGELKAIVATASLELGIDIGTVDLVCQIGTPRAISTALQRIGRSGHWYGAISKGIFFATTLEELTEIAALIYAIKQKDLDKLIIPNEPLDILAQHIVALCVSEEWHEEKLYQLIRKSYPYKELSVEKYKGIIYILSQGISSKRGRYGSYLFYDQINSTLAAKRGARLAAIMNSGAIPENGLFSVIAQPTNTMVGTLDEDFAVESNRGDVILLGSTSWMVKQIESKLSKVIVEDAHGAPPSVPFWRGEAPGRTNELSHYVSELRHTLHLLLDEENAGKNWLITECNFSDYAASQLISYLLEGSKILGTIPTQENIVAERFFDESGGMQLVIHAPFGARINKAWGLALRKKFCRSFNLELQASATDNGLNIALAEQHSFPLADVFQFLNPKTIKDVLTQAVLQSPFFVNRWRWVATRSLALLKYRGGRKIPPNIQRMLADDLLAAVFPDAAACQDNLGGRDIELPDHPLIEETMKEIFEDALDLKGLTTVLQNLYDNTIKFTAVDTPMPSVFSHELLNANPFAYLDDAPLEERRSRAVNMRRILPEDMQENLAMLDPEAIEEVKKQAWPDIRDKNELHDFLQTIIALPINALDSVWSNYYEELVLSKRLGIATVSEENFIYPFEKENSFFAIYPQAKKLNFSPVVIENTVPTKEAALQEMIKGWLFHLGPTTAFELQEKLKLSFNDIEATLLFLETTGLILRGKFRSNNEDHLEWCERRLLSRIHFLTTTKLRREIAAVSPKQFMHWLLSWQHVAPGTQLIGEHGLLEVIRQLQGCELPANAWEKDIFSVRIKNYQKSLLDDLCLKGIVGWGRLSKPIMDKKRIVPTSISPITFFLRGECDWLMPHSLAIDQTPISHLAKEVYAFLKHHGASFFFDIVKGVNHLKAEVELALWELVSVGLITADGFDSLRSLIDKKRRLGRDGRKRHKTYATGRWALLHKMSFEINEQHMLEATCFLLLKRYGVVFRDLLTREKNLPPWRDLYKTFRILEYRGEIRSGRFVEGFVGEQFALPSAIESLRAIKNKSVDSIYHLSAVDPLNLVGIIIDGDKTAAISGKEVSIIIT